MGGNSLSNSAMSSPLQSNANIILSNKRENEGMHCIHSLEDIEYILGNREKPEPIFQISKTEHGGLCLVCGKTFSQFGNCRTHFMAVHGEDGTGHHICVVCGSRFNFEVNFKSHMKGKHKLTGKLKRCVDFGDSTMMAKDENGSGVCLVCCQVFSKFGNCRTHYKAKHAN